MTVRGAARYTAATLGGIESLDVTVAATEMARLGLLIPPLRTTVPGALRLSGAGSGSLRASPTEVNIELDLDGANVRLGEALQKNAGDRLQVSLHGNRDSDAAHHREGANRASGRVDAAVDVVLPHGVHIMGDVMFQPGGPDIALFDLHTNRPTLAHAATLSPVLRDLVAGAVEKGSLRVAMLGMMSDVGSRFDFTLRGHGVRIVVNDGKTIAAGDTTMALVAVTDSSGLRLDVFARLDGLALSSADGDRLLFEKKTGVPLTVQGHLVEAHGRGALGRALSAVDAKDEEAAVVFVASGLSARWRRIALGLNGAVSVRGDQAHLFGVDIIVDLALRQGRMVFRRGDFTLPTGPVSIATSAVNIGTAVPQWELRVVAVDVSLAQVLQPLQAVTGAVSGTVTVDAQLKGVGLSLESLVESVQGPVRFAAHT